MAVVAPAPPSPAARSAWPRSAPLATSAQRPALRLRPLARRGAGQRSIGYCLVLNPPMAARAGVATVTDAVRRRSGRRRCLLSAAWGARTGRAAPRRRRWDAPAPHRARGGRRRECPLGEAACPGEAAGAGGRLLRPPRGECPCAARERAGRRWLEQPVAKWPLRGCPRVPLPGAGATSTPGQAGRRGWPSRRAAVGAASCPVEAALDAVGDGVAAAGAGVGFGSGGPVAPGGRRGTRAGSPRQCRFPGSP